MTLEQQIRGIGSNARGAARALAALQTEKRNAILRAMAGELLGELQSCSKRTKRMFPERRNMA